MLRSQTSTAQRYFNLLLALCFLSLFLFLGDSLFQSRGSSREAVVSLSMLQTGNWVLPINNGVDMAYKPPFFHWLIALCSLPVGSVTELTARLPSALALTLLTQATYKFYAPRTSPQLALLIGVILLTTFETHRAALTCRVDMLLAAMTICAIYKLYQWVENGMNGIPVLGVLALSAACLTKGPVGAVLPCFAVCLYALLMRQAKTKTFLRFVGVGLLSLLLPLVWYVAAWRQGGSEFLQLVYEENVLRLLGKMTYESHVNPWTYNVLTLLSGFLPYTLLLLLALPVLPWKKLRLLAPVRTLFRRCIDYLRSQPSLHLFTLLTFLVIFVFYCIPKSKRSVYLLPVYPFVAFYVARFILWLQENHKRVLSTLGWVLATLAVLLTSLEILIILGFVPDSIVMSGKHPVETMAMFRALSSPFTRAGVLNWLAALAPLVGIMLFIGSRVRKRRRLASILALIFAVHFALDGFYQPLVLNTKSDKPVAEEIRRLCPTGRIYSFRAENTPGNPLHPFTINFYLGDRVAPVEAFAPMPTAGYLIVGGEDIRAFQSRYPAYNVREVIDFHRRSCDDHNYLHLYTFSRK